jgi:hypothetical protein
MSRPGRKPPIHKYTFEVWPPDTNGASYPIQLPEHVSAWAATPEAALKKASVQVPDGWLIIHVGHVRSQCEPPHPGIQ